MGLTASNEEEEKFLSQEVQGIASMDLDEYSGMAVPKEWEITGLFGDIIQVEYADVEESELAGELINRGGILVNTNATRYTWRVGKCILKGPAVKYVNVGDYVMFPSDKGIPLTKFNGKDFVFLNEERIFSIVEPTDENKTAK
jgi:co-chaperonin GroES (HSP10)